MKLDVRVPAGLMLAIIGLLLAVYGIAGDQSIYARSLGINVNLIWGCALIAAGGVLLGLAARKRRRERS
jgi:hypothetical protein